MPKSRVSSYWPLCLLVLALACVAEKEPPERIILLVVDTLRADQLAAYGGSLDLPHLNGLAARGQVFTDSVSSFHQTSMSMAGLFTGLTPSLETGDASKPLEWNRGNRCGMARYRSVGDPACLPSAVTTLAEDMRRAGYSTLGVTANPLLYRPAGYDQGFDHWTEVGILPGGEMNNVNRRRHAESRAGEHVNEQVIAALSARTSDRFFLYVHYLDVHDWYLLGRTYQKSVEVQDRLVGQLLAHLDREGLLEGATVIFTSDHGEELGEPHPIRPMPAHLGNPSYDSVLRVPLIVAPPFFEATDRPLRGVDVRNLIRRIAGLDPLPAMERVDEEGPGEEAELFVSEVRYQTYRKGRYKSIWPRNGDESLLLDLLSDPGESESRALEEPVVLRRHRARLDALTSELATRRTEKLDDADREEDLQRLHVLGYIE